MNYSKHVERILKTWPDPKLEGQLCGNPVWKEGEVQGPVKVRRDALYRLRETWQIPSRVTLEGDGSYGRHYYTAACGENFPEGDPLIEIMLPSAKLEALESNPSPKEQRAALSANGNFDAKIKKASLNCQKAGTEHQAHAAGIYLRAAQRGVIEDVFILSPRRWGIHVGEGSRSIRLTDINIEHTFDKRVGEHSQAEGINSWRSRSVTGMGLTFVGLQCGIELVGCEVWTLMGVDFENCETPIRLSKGTEGCEIIGVWAHNHRGPLADFSGQGVGPCKPGNVIRGTVRGDTSYIDRNGLSVHVPDGPFEIRS